MAKKTSDLRASLYAAKDGIAACDAINSLAKLAKKHDKEAKDILAAYVLDGPIDHMRTFACAQLAEAATEADSHLATVFHGGLSDEHLRYWSILGYLRVRGKSAYDDLVRIAKKASLPMDVRCHAVKCLAQFSKQRFDRHLPSDPGHWKESDLRLDEIARWKDRAYPDGQEYPEPQRHPALDEPTTPFEEIVTCLDKKLAKQRRACQDLAEPTNWLAVAAAKDLKKIKSRWNLPAIYLDFLNRFSPIRVTIQSRRFYDPFNLFGAGELIDAQDGYLYNSIEQRPLDDWPAHLLVIANHGGDPFVLDLSKSDDHDAPVDTAEHGIGVWEFAREADSFSQFLKALAR